MVVASILIIIGATLLSPYGRHQWALSLIRQPTPYTALSFNQASALPSTAVARQPIRISFTVGNHEDRAVDYRYVLSESSKRSSRILRESARKLAAGAAWTVSTVVRPACTSSACHIEVSLPGHPEVIDFMVTLVASGSKHG
jgi:hypothetical protein